MVTIRMIRMGKKNRPVYRIVVQDSRRKAGGAYLEALGHYRPMEKGENLTLDLSRVEFWRARGAGVSTTVAKLVKLTGKKPAA